MNQSAHKRLNKCTCDMCTSQGSLVRSHFSILQVYKGRSDSHRPQAGHNQNTVIFRFEVDEMSFLLPLPPMFPSPASHPHYISLSPLTHFSFFSTEGGLTCLIQSSDAHMQIGSYVLFSHWEVAKERQMCAGRWAPRQIWTATLTMETPSAVSSSPRLS